MNNMPEGKKKRKKRKWLRNTILLLILLAIVAIAVMYFYGGMGGANQAANYSSYTATIGSISNSMSFSGNLELIDGTTYTAQSSTTVRNIYVSEGDVVSDGDKLMRLANGQTIEAEFDGRVNQIPVETDDSVRSGDALIQVADFDHLKVVVNVDEYDIADVHVGQECVVTTTATEQTFTTSIASIDYVSSTNSSVAYYGAMAYVNTDDAEDIYPGMQVTLTIPQEEADHVVILKEEAIQFDITNQAFVWMKDSSGALQRVDVEVGVSNGNYVEIASGLSEGDVVYAVASNADSTSGMNGMMMGGGMMGGGMMGGGSMGSGSMGNMGGGQP